MIDISDQMGEKRRKIDKHGADPAAGTLQIEGEGSARCSLTGSREDKHFLLWSG
jgi:hypothetical protein